MDSDETGCVAIKEDEIDGLDSVESETEVGVTGGYKPFGDTTAESGCTLSSVALWLIFGLWSDSSTAGDVRSPAAGSAEPSPWNLEAASHDATGNELGPNI